MTNLAPGGEIQARPVSLMAVHGGQHLIDAHAPGPAHDQTRPVVSWTVARGPVLSGPVVSGPVVSGSVKNGGARSGGARSGDAGNGDAGNRPVDGRERVCHGGRTRQGGGGGRYHSGTGSVRHHAHLPHQELPWSTWPDSHSLYENSSEVL